MYLDVVTKVPDIPGHIFPRTKGKTTYVYYQYGQVYDTKRKFCIPQRAVIGKLNSAGQLIPNENYHKYFSGENLPGEKPLGFRSGCLRVGAYFVIKKLIDECKLSEVLRECFDGRELGFVCDLVAYALVSENNAAQYYPDYAFNHPLFTEGMKMYSDSRVSELLNSIDDNQILGFLNHWNAQRNHSEKIYISYDATNKNCQAGDIEMVEFGKAKDDLSKPVFNYSIAYDRTNREPLFYEEYPGSIVDVSQLQFMLEKARAYGYTDVGFILDRGYFSKDNIEFLDECGYSFIFMMRGMRNLVSNLIMENQGSFEKERSYYIQGFSTYGKTVMTKMYPEDEKERYFHIFYSIRRAHADQDEIEQKIERLTKLLSKYEGKKCEFSDNAIRKYFALHYDSAKTTFLFARENAEVITHELKLAGYFVIVTSEEMSATEALKRYKSRDDSEKLFRGDKSYLGNRSLRVCSDESASAKIFIEFIALILRNRFYTYLKNAVIKNEKKANYMTVPAAIRELEKIEMIRQGDGIYRLDHAVTATQKAILSAFGLDEGFIREEAKKLSELVKKLS